jgi:tRNA 2-thiouridine synthesizing protein A
MVMEANQTIDCKGLSCPMPILKLAKTMKKMKSGEVLELVGTDPGSKDDIPKWCTKTGNDFLEMIEDTGFNRYFIRKK